MGRPPGSELRAQGLFPPHPQYSTVQRVQWEGEQGTPSEGIRGRCLVDVSPALPCPCQDDVLPATLCPSLLWVQGQGHQRRLSPSPKLHCEAGAGRGANTQEPESLWPPKGSGPIEGPVCVCVCVGGCVVVSRNSNVPVSLSGESAPGAGTNERRVQEGPGVTCLFPRSLKVPQKAGREMGACPFHLGGPPKQTGVAAGGRPCLREGILGAGAR